MLFQVPICAECMVTDHKPPKHEPERVQELEDTEREFFKNLISDSKSKISTCEEASTSLMSSLTELASQRDNAKDLINETFQSYKAILEKKRVSEWTGKTIHITRLKILFWVVIYNVNQKIISPKVCWISCLNSVHLGCERNLILIYFTEVRKEY